MTLRELFGFSWLFNLFKPEPEETNEFELTESMWGFVSLLNEPFVSDEEVPDDSVETYRRGYEKGRQAGNRLSFTVTLHVDNYKAFVAPSGRRAPMTGKVTCKNLFGENRPISNGEYGLYWVDPKTGERRISYRFEFEDSKGQRFRFSGKKKIVDDPGCVDILEDHTTLFTVIRRLGGGDPIVAKGIIHYHVEDFPAMVLSIRTPKEDTLLNRMRMTARFFSFVNKELGEYVQSIRPTYRCEYNNLVITGKCETAGEVREFFFFSGVHDKGFPWGDNIGLSDIGLVIRQGEDWQRYVITAEAVRSLEMRLGDGRFSYEGPLCHLTSGNHVSFSELASEPLPPHLTPVPVSIDLRFSVKSVEKKQIPFEIDMRGLKRHHDGVWEALTQSRVVKELKKWRDIPDTLGYESEVLQVANVQGTFTIDGARHDVHVSDTIGEAENGALSSFRTPSLYYNYFCALEPESNLFRIFIRSGVLRSLSDDGVTAKVGDVLGNIIGQFVKKSIRVDGKGVEELDWNIAREMTIPLEEILEINSDHFHGRLFQRRIVALPGLLGARALALEENMSALSLEAIGTKRHAVVAAVKREDRFAALEAVLAKTDFFDKLDAACLASGKGRASFSIVVKPSFSFMYSLSDPSTYTDPNLVEYLMDRLYEKGYRTLYLAEAESTYATFFTHRDVPTLARYVGYQARNYTIVDLSENTVPHEYDGVLGNHTVHPVWRDADYRISFAKNKTHSYAYYTLTLKNIYGALPEVNKFKAYHCDAAKGIYRSTIDFLSAFPVHFGFIDAYLSADGAFGIFADKTPNFTSTVIGGDDLVAVDWVAASKMGLDPLVSEYMRLAVARFGKPEIHLVGDHSLYRNWRNVPNIVSRAAHGLIDENYLFGNFLYSVMASMDPFFRFKPDEVGRRIGRVLTKPVRKILFEWITGDRESLTVAHLEKMLEPDQLKYMKEVLGAVLER